ncbi:MAG: cysteine--tRNA ligase [Candidatus Dormibacteria bacterium]
MTQIRVFNTMGRELQDFQPMQPGRVMMYSCGPTVYKYSHIGNFRSYLMADFWIRAFEYLGFAVTQVQNITDVGHLVDDGESGDDKVLAAAEAEGKSPEEIAAFYTEAFRADAHLLGIRPPDAAPRATEYIAEMIEAISRLEQLGLAYAVDGNVYYDVVKRRDYPKLSHNTLDQLLAGARVEVDERKRNAADFALWKAAGPRRMQVWESPWGLGFPGWHIECTAMSLGHFPGGFDIHTGGVDNIFPHHEDEIAQSEPLLDNRPVARYWIHGEFLTGDGGRKMAKSAGDMLRVSGLAEQGYDPLSFRFLCLGARYRTRLSFTQEALDAASSGLASLRRRASRLRPAVPLTSPGGNALQARFVASLCDDLDLPVISALLQEVLRAEIPEGEKRTLLEDWDRVLGVALTRAVEELPEAIPEAALALAARRDEARRARDWVRADEFRGQLESMGFAVEDSAAGSAVKRR